MNAIFLATASCSPTGRPHCTRSRDHSLAIFSTGFGRYRCFCSWVPNSATGCGTPIDWCADNSPHSAGEADPAITSARL